MRHALFTTDNVDDEAVGVSITADGSTVVSRDVMPDGQLGGPQSPMLQTQSAGHAKVLASILEDTHLFLMFSCGEIDQSVIDLAAEEINRLDADSVD